MKISRLILITSIIICTIFVCCNGAGLKAKSQNPSDDAMENEIKKVLRATLFHGNHPSVNGGMREVATCITEEALDAAMEGVVIKSYHGFKQNATVQLRNKICK
uniref:Uncharacterized protein n=1 Tax=Panagrolaimus davidi TaxID=227884 RepID=A0A914Q2Z9_9BILA